MRLVSQNGEFDVPYEITSLSRTGNIIRAYVPMVGEKGTVMARYSTDEKAQKAMKALHKVYAGMFLAQNVEMSDDDYEECIKMAARDFQRMMKYERNRKKENKLGFHCDCGIIA